MVVRPRHGGGAGWSALDFPVAVQFVRQGQHLQAWAFEAAQVQVVVFHRVGAEHREQFAASTVAGGNDYFTDRRAVGGREDRGTRGRDGLLVQCQSVLAALELARYCMRATIS